MKFDVCIDKVFFMKNFVESMERTKKAGVTAYEYWKWWEKDTQALLQKQSELELECVTFCTKFISLLDPAQRGDYMQGLIDSIAMAKIFGVNLLISQTGYTLKDVPEEEQWQSMIQGLRECAPILEEAGVTLIVEPLNLQDHPSYFLTRSKDAFRMIDEVGSERVKILYDIYHFQITEGNLIKTITDNIGKIGHFHCAGNPGRGNITKGEIAYAEVFRAIRDLGYQGYVGLECGMFLQTDEGIAAAKQLFDASLLS